MPLSTKNDILLKELISNSASETEPIIQILAWMLYRLSRGEPFPNSVIVDFLQNLKQTHLALKDETAAASCEAISSYYEFLWQQREKELENNRS